MVSVDLGLVVRKRADCCRKLLRPLVPWSCEQTSPWKSIAEVTGTQNLLWPVAVEGLLCRPASCSPHLRRGHMDLGLHLTSLRSQVLNHPKS